MSDYSITEILGRRVWDSRGRPTVEAEVILGSGQRGRAMAPAGASTGSGEALDLRDADGIDVRRALVNIRHPIREALIGLDVREQTTLDRILVELDGTPAKTHLGGNACVAVSMACLWAAAAAEGVAPWQWLAGDHPVRLPLPEIQIIGGGAHAARRVDIQDFMIVCPGADSVAEALDWSARVYRGTGELLAEAGQLAGVADEGGYWPLLDSNEAALALLTRAIEQAGFRAPEQVAISLDIAASQFYRDGVYRLARDDRTLDGGGLIAMLRDWLGRYPIVSVEDPLVEDDAEGIAAFTRAVEDRVQVVGDDFLVTSALRVAQAANLHACNALLVKPNQAGTLSEAHAALMAAREAGWGTIVSARSGETEDVTVAHLAVGWNAGQIKVGAFSRSERMCKWNELLRIEEALGADAKFAGGAVLPPRGSDHSR